MILVTGGAGYIGSHTCVALAAAGLPYLVLDNFSNSNPGVLERVGRITGTTPRHVQGDVRDAALLERVFAQYPVTAVVHFAALKAVGESVREPLRYYDNNVAGTLTLLGAMQAAQVRSLVFSSSATVYGEPASLPIREDFPLSATNPYGWSKLMVEQMLADVDAAEPGQAAQRPEPRLRSRRERRHTGARHRQYRARHHRRDQPGQRGSDGGRQRHPDTAPGPRTHQRHHQREQQTRRRQPGQGDPEDQAPAICARLFAFTAENRAQITREGDPGQAAIADEQAPVPLQQPLGDVGIPHRDGGGHQLPAETGVQNGSCQPSRAPAGEPQPQDQQCLDQHAAVDDGREHGQEEVLRQSPGRGLGQAQGSVGQVGPRRRDRVAQQQITGRQQRRGDSERQPQRVQRRQGTTKSDQIRSGGRSVGRWVGSFSVMASAAGIGPESVSRRPKKPCPAASRPGSISAACDRRL